MTYDKRAKAVADFYANKSIRVFVFSRVGTAGLNLANADVVIFLVSHHPLPFVDCTTLVTGSAMVFPG